MASTAGRKRRPLPASLEHDLQRIGFVYRQTASDGLTFYVWQHKLYRSLELHVARANVPGSQYLVYGISGETGSTTEEELIRRLEITIEFRSHPNTFIEKASKP